MADLATLLARRDELEKARASGVLTVEYDGRRITYRSDAELASALAALAAQIAAAQGRPRITDIRFSTSKGLSA